MNVKNIFCKLMYNFQYTYAKRSSSAYCNWLRDRGVQIRGGIFILGMH